MINPIKNQRLCLHQTFDSSDLGLGKQVPGHFLLGQSQQSYLQYPAFVKRERQSVIACDI